MPAHLSCAKMLSMSEKFLRSPCQSSSAKFRICCADARVSDALRGKKPWCLQYSGAICSYAISCMGSEHSARRQAPWLNIAHVGSIGAS